MSGPSIGSLRTKTEIIRANVRGWQEGYQKDLAKGIATRKMSDG